jgi:WD40 repeat protein
LFADNKPDDRDLIEFIALRLEQHFQDPKQSLKPIERQILTGVFAGTPYQNIASQAGFNTGYIRTQASELWEKIGKSLDTQERVKKRNVKRLAETAFARQNSNSQPQLPDWRRAILLHPAWQAHPDGIGGVAICPSGHTIATGGWDGTIKLWNLTTGKLHQSLIESGTISAHTEDITALIFTPDGNTLISASYDRTIKLWALNTGELLSTLRKQTNRDRPQTLYDHTHWVESLALSPDGRVLASGGFDCDLYLWDLLQPRSLQRLQTKSPILAIAFSPDGWQLACGCIDGTLEVWDLRSIDRSPNLEFDRSDSWISAIKFAPDGEKIYSGNGRGEIGVWDVVTGQKIDGWQCHTSAILTLAFHPKDANLLVSGGYDRTIVFWNLKGRKLLHQLPEHEGAIAAMSFDRTGNILLVGDELGKVIMWQTLDRASLSS